MEREFAEITTSTNQRNFALRDFQVQFWHLEEAIGCLSGQILPQSRILGITLSQSIVGELTMRKVHLSTPKDVMLHHLWVPHQKAQSPKCILQLSSIIKLEKLLRTVLSSDLGLFPEPQVNVSPLT